MPTELGPAKVDGYHLGVSCQSQYDETTNGDMARFGGSSYPNPSLSSRETSIWANVIRSNSTRPLWLAS